jgi:hypothetical protein
MNYEYILAIDCGLMGAITILNKNDDLPIIYKIPVKKVIINKKNKNIYDVDAILQIIKNYKDKKLLYIVEKQSVRNGEGAVSAMTIGKNYGMLLGMGYALDFDVIEVSPQTWKKYFPELITPEIINKKGEMKELRQLSKNLKDKEEKKENKRQVDKLGRQAKALAKTNARQLASRLYPEIEDKFQKVNTDGLAESLLIAIYGKNELGKG